MKIADLIYISKNISDNSVVLTKFNQFIEKMGSKDSTVSLTPTQIYALISELDLFNHDLCPVDPMHWTPSIKLIYELRKLIIGEISSDLIDTTSDYMPLKSRDAINVLIGSNSYQHHALTEKNFVCLIGMGENAFSALMTFSKLTKYGFLDDWSRNIIIDVYSKVSKNDADTIGIILIELAQFKQLNKDIFTSIVFNPYKKWHGFQALALITLIDHHLLSPYQDLVLRDAEHAYRIALNLALLYKLPEWLLVKEMLSRRPEDAFNITQIFYKDYEVNIKNQLRKKSPKKSDKEIHQECFLYLLELTSKKPLTESDEKKSDVQSVKSFSLFNSLAPNPGSAAVTKSTIKTITPSI